MDPLIDPAPRPASKLERPAQRVLTRVIIALILSASAALITRQLLNQIDTVRSQLEMIRFAQLIWPLVATLMAIMVDTLCWHWAVAASTGRPRGLKFVESFAILNASNLSKYLPGKFWAYGLQAQILRTRGVPVAATLHANVTVIFSAITAAGWLLTFGALWLPNRLGAIASAAILSALLICVHLYYGPLVAILVRFLKRRFAWSLPIEAPSKVTYLTLVLLYLVNLALLGSAAAFVLSALGGALTPARFAAVTIITAVSWLVGYAAFMRPSSSPLVSVFARRR